MWNALEAEPRNVSLQSLSPHFFEFGRSLAGMLGDEELADSLIDAFTKRFRGLLCEAHSTGEAKYRDILTKEEARLYHKGRDSVRAFTEWKYSKHERIQAATPIRAQKRRRMHGAAHARSDKTSRRL